MQNDTYNRSSRSDDCEWVNERILWSAWMDGKCLIGVNEEKKEKKSRIMN